MSGEGVHHIFWGNIRKCLLEMKGASKANE